MIGGSRFRDQRRSVGRERLVASAAARGQRENETEDRVRARQSPLPHRGCLILQRAGGRVLPMFGAARVGGGDDPDRYVLSSRAHQSERRTSRAGQDIGTRVGQEWAASCNDRCCIDRVFQLLRQEPAPSVGVIMATAPTPKAWRLDHRAIDSAAHGMRGSSIRSTSRQDLEPNRLLEHGSHAGLQCHPGSHRGSPFWAGGFSRLASDVAVKGGRQQRLSNPEIPRESRSKVQLDHE